MHWWMRALVLPTYVHVCAHQDFHCNAQNYMCMQYFSADELTAGDIPEMKNTEQPPILFSFTHVYFSSPEFGGWSNEQLHVCHPYTQ